MKTAVLTMLVLLTCSIWYTWLFSLQKKWDIGRSFPLLIATILMTALTVGYGTYYGSP
jgi:hypothetical protein